MTVKLYPLAKTQATRVIAILALLFAIPVVISWALYYGKTELGFGTTNRGYLLNPPLQLSKLQLKLINGVPATNIALPKKWNILYLTSDEDFDPARQLQVFDKIQRVRLALGKDFSRVAQSYGVPFKEDSGNLNSDISKHFQHTMQLAIGDAGVHLLLQQLPLIKPQSEAIFIIDPHGNVILSYKASVAPDDIYKDLQRLLQYSSIG